jgi:hydrogenase-4 component B
MTLFFLGMAFIVASGAAALCCGRRASLAAVFGVGGLTAGSVLIVSAAVTAASARKNLLFIFGDSKVFGDLAFGIDPLSGLFLVPVLLLGVVCGLYGIGYLEPHGKGKNCGAQWFWYDLLAAGMVGVLAARDFLSLAVCWELMTMASYFLVAFEHENPQVRKSALVYLIASHCSIACLLPGFVILSGLSSTGESLLFPSKALEAAVPGSAAVFILTFCGFGIKAGFFPVHVWLPEAHPAAPSHVSALLSGGMIKMGIYGILRIVSFFTMLPLWWAEVILLTGCVSAVLGILFSLGQRDLKRILAYSSVENMGIIAIGIGAGLIGLRAGNIAVGFLGIAGALLHVLNHGVFKGLLFLGAGSVFHGTGIRDIERLGGLAKGMKHTATAMTLAAAAICALPPFGGFVSEFLMYLGMLKGIVAGNVTETVLLAAACALLALTGGIALLSFTRLVGIPFLGQPRDPKVVHAHESGRLMTIPMLFLGGLIALMGVGAPLLIRIVEPAAATVIRGFAGASGSAAGAAAANLSAAASGALSDAAAATNRLVRIISAALGVFILLVLIVAAARRIFLTGKEVREAETWGCGYLYPTPRMQYTGASFAHPILKLFKGIVQYRETVTGPGGIFPKHGSYRSEHPDPAARFLVSPLFGWARTLFGRLMFIQHGRVHVYILYIVLTLIVLLLWNLR